MPDFFFIGEEELLVAFRLAGVAGVSVSNREEALESFLAVTKGRGEAPSSDEGPRRDLTGVGAKVLILSSAIAGLIEEEARDWQIGGNYPLIVEIPSPGAAPDEGRSLLAAIREAVGISI